MGCAILDIDGLNARFSVRLLQFIMSGTFSTLLNVHSNSNAAMSAMCMLIRAAHLWLRSQDAQVPQTVLRFAHLNNFLRRTSIVSGLSYRLIRHAMRGSDNGASQSACLLLLRRLAEQHKHHHSTLQLPCGHYGHVVGQCWTPRTLCLARRPGQAGTRHRQDKGSSVTPLCRFTVLHR